MSSPSGEHLTTFDEADERAKLPALPKSVNSGKVVQLSAKKLQTVKEVRTVLPEQEYLHRLQKIIVRDYFPELPKLKAQKEYLDAVAANDFSKVRELQLRYSTKRTERRTSPTARRRSPDVFDADTPGPSRPSGDVMDSQRSDLCNRMGDNEAKKEKKEEDKMTVDSYLNKYTSEDNASFEELAALHLKKERIRNAWMYEAEERHNKELVTRGTEPIKAADEQLMIASAPGTSDEKPKDLDNWTYKARNAVLFDMDEVPLTIEEHIKRQKMNQRLINKKATRFSEQSRVEPNQGSMARVAMLQAVNQQGKVDISGKEVGTIKASSLDLLATPSPAPGVEDSPFMTWGEIEGTPFRLDASDMPITGGDSAPAFKIPDVPVREKIAQEMTEMIAKRYRDKRKAAIREVEKHHSRTPGFGTARSTGRLSMMSPAARRLATKGLGIRLNSDKALKASYTPTRARIPSTGIRTPSSSLVLRRTPSRTQSDASPIVTNSSITDNLLQFGDTAPTQNKSRPSAADFF
uniref:ES2-like protein n=1 Tax=Ascaris suum TaxID=6253 RepID=F1L2C9_ASCSU